MLLIPLVLSSAAVGGITEFREWAAQNNVASQKVALAPDLGRGLRGVVAAENLAVSAPFAWALLPVVSCAWLKMPAVFVLPAGGGHAVGCSLLVDDDSQHGAGWPPVESD